MNSRQPKMLGRRCLPAAVSLLLACSPTDTECIDICSIWSVVEGTVTTSSGSPVSEASVELHLMHDRPDGGGGHTCQISEGEVVHRTSTDATGAFAAKLHGISLLPPDCVEITVNGPEGSALVSVVDTLRVDWSLNEASPPVSRINLVMPN